MKIKDIYNQKNYCIISIVTALLCILITLITTILPNIYTSLTYAYPIKYPWQIISGLFVHGSPNLDISGTIGHLGFNLLLILPFGILLEKIIGSKKFLKLSLCLWIINALTFYIMAFFLTPAGENTYGAGISGIAFSYGIIGLYILYKLLKKDRKLLLKQISFYLLLNIVIIMLIMINPFVAGVSSMIMHIVAVLSGIIFLLISHKDIDTYIENSKN